MTAGMQGTSGWWYDGSLRYLAFASTLALSLTAGLALLRAHGRKSRASEERHRSGVCELNHTSFVYLCIRNLRSLTQLPALEKDT